MTTGAKAAPLRLARVASPLPLGALAWRYALAGASWLSFAIPWLLFRLDPGRWATLTPALSLLNLAHPLAWVDLSLGLAALVLVGWRRRAPLTVSLLLAGLSGLSMSALVPALWGLVSLATNRRWAATALAAVACVICGEMTPWLPWSAIEHESWWLELTAAAVLTGALSWLGASIGHRRERVPTTRGPSPALETLRAMFEPARYPAPRLDGLSTAWRYALAASIWLFFLSIYSFMADPVRVAEVTASASGTPREQASLAPGLSVSGPSEPLQLPPVAALVADLALGLAALVAMRCRRRWPFGVFLAVQLATVLSLSASGAAAWALASLATRRKLRDIGLAVGVVAVTALAARFVPWRGSAHTLPEDLAGFVYILVWTAGLALLGMYYGTRQDRAAGFADRIASVDRDRELAVLSERNRIAREMHDVLAHRISLVSMHAGALAYRDDLLPEQTRAIAHIIQENAHASLTELRSVLSTLRDGQLAPGGTPAGPQPTLADLPDLLAEARAFGQRVTLASTLDVADVPQVTARHAFRILQECLTNARKHAPYSPTEVRLAGAPGVGLDLHVTNQLTVLAGGVPSAGFGLVGIRERVAMLGGRVTMGARDHRFVVDCWLPWPA